MPLRTVSKRKGMLSVDWEKSALLHHWPESSRLKAVKDEKRSGIFYTFPGLKSDELLVSDADSDVQAFYEQHFCRVDTELNQQGFSKLLRLGYVEVALNGTTVLLSQLGQGAGKVGKPSHTTELTLQLWSLRFQLLMILKMQQQAIDEMAPFEELNAPDLFYQYNQKSDRTGSMVPFSMRLLHAEILRNTPFPWKSMERIDRLRSDVEWVISDLSSSDAPTTSISQWKSRLLAVDKLKSRVLFILGEYSQSMRHLNAAKETTTDSEEKSSMCSSMMRMALSVGDEKSANQYLTESAQINNGRLLVHKALRSIFLGAYPHASDYVQRLNKANDTRPVVSNTSAITLLYTGKVQEGLQILSKCKKPLPEHLMMNLKAMAELGLSAAQKETLMHGMNRKRSTAK